MMKKLLIVFSLLGVIFGGLNFNQAFAQAKVFKQTLSWMNYSFDIETKDNKLVFKPHNLVQNNQDEIQDITGYTINNTQIGDIDNDSYPEIFIYLTADDNSKYGQLIVFSCDKGSKMDLVTVKAIEDNKDLAKNYRGHDLMMIKDNMLLRVFPIYLENDTDDNPTGGMRKIEYKLITTAKAKILQPINYTDYKISDEKIIN